MPLTEQQNFIRNITMTGPQWTPCVVGLSASTWDYLKGDLEKIVLRHPTLFPGYKQGNIDFQNMDFGPGRRKGEPFTDAWGCTWESAINGLEGVVIKHPIASWNDLDSYRAPDPMTQNDRGPAQWEEWEQAAARQRKDGKVVIGYVAHGFFFMRLQYLRGFENLMLDMMEARKELPRLIGIVLQHNKALLKKLLSHDIDVLGFGEDLGTQTSSIISPALFKKYIFPYYREMFALCREKGVYVTLHSDGYIMELIDMLIDAGIQMINLQDLCNGVDAIARTIKGRVAIRLDVDRQTTVPFGKPREIRELIKEEIMKLGSPKGGLEMIAGIYPPTPPENIEAVCSAFEEFRTYWFDGRKV